MSLSLAAMAHPPASIDRTTLRFLSDLPLFRGLSPEAVRDAASCMTPRRVRRGQTLWAQEHRPDEVIFIRSGVVMLQRRLGAHEVTLDYIGRGEILGLGGVAEACEATMHEDGVLLTMDRSDFAEWLQAHPRAIEAAVTQASQDGGRLAQRLALVSMHGARARLALLLLDLATRFGVRDSRGTIIDLRLTHRELAALIGATRETVSVAVVELRQSGLIATEARRAIVLDEEGLREACA